VAALNHRALHREAALARDLDVLCGPGWRDHLPLAPAAQAYVGRLQALAANAPHLLAAHAYVRYLGDLHGGQMLKRLVARSLSAAGELAPLAATHFYEFGSDDEVLALRQAFRDGLARIVVDAAAADALVAEARWAFERHVALFTELAAKPQPAHQPVA
jgi:heme oxygenase